MRTDTAHLIPNTTASTRVCKMIAERSNGVCLFGFSRGKDSVAAWLQLRRFFKRIIPFHVCMVPHLSIVDKSLAYYEKEFGTPIHRCIQSLYRFSQLLYQRIEDEDAIEALKIKSYNNNDIADTLKEHYGLPPTTYTAYGIQASDSLFRRLRMTKKGDRGIIRDEAAYREKAHTFFPCFDWSREQIYQAIEVVGLRLPDDYNLANRTLANLDWQHLPRLTKMYPKDMARIRAMYPFIESHLARNAFRALHQNAKGCGKISGLSQRGKGVSP